MIEICHKFSIAAAIRNLVFVPDVVGVILKLQMGSDDSVSLH